MNRPGLLPHMTPGPPRLLLAVHERAGFRDTVTKRLPDVPFAFLEELLSDGRAGVEAALVGSMGREAVGWDPNAYPRLRFVQRLFAGVDDLPFNRIPDRVAVAGNVGGYSPFVAEHALALALACARCVVTGHQSIAAGRARPPPELRTLWREPVLILGYGAIGTAIAERLRPFEVHLMGMNRDGRPAPGVETMYSAAQLREGLAQAAYVFEVRPLTARTVGSLGRDELSAMRDDATLVNVGRGGTIDQAALYDHLVAHPRFRAGVDVWWEEDLAHGRVSSRYPFTDLPNFVGSPHWAGFAPAVESYALGTALDNLARFFAGEPPFHVVDRAEYTGLGPGKR